jgi:hypothetical protein
MRAAWLVVLVSLAVGCRDASAPPTAETTVAQPRPASLQTRRRCCKVCKKGKPCGDTCIAKSKECHEPPGCAC